MDGNSDAELFHTDRYGRPVDASRIIRRRGTDIYLSWLPQLPIPEVQPRTRPDSLRICISIRDNSSLTAAAWYLDVEFKLSHACYIDVNVRWPWALQQ